MAAPWQKRLQHRLQVVWLPLLIVLLDGLLLAFVALLLLGLAPFVFLALLLIFLFRMVIATLSGGRWLARRRSAEMEVDVLPAGRTTLTPSQRRDLALRFRPCLVMYPEDPEMGPPYRTGPDTHLFGADYQPRPVEMFLNHVRYRHGRTQWLPDLPDLTDPADIRASLGQPGEEESSLEIPWLHGGNPLRVVRHLFPFGRQLRAHWAIPVPKTDCGCSYKVWERYIRILEEDRDHPEHTRRYPHTIYARVLQGRELPEIGPAHPLADAIALQYWWFLFYNDAWNRHQGDWEGITVFLHGGADGYRPVGAAYACHDLGRWRRWQDLQRLDDDGVPGNEGNHPLVYLARGSHAAYFDYNESGYHPSMSRGLRVPFLGDVAIPSQFVLETRSATDWVADAHTGVGNGMPIFTDNVRVMPPEETLRDLPRLRADDDWWWLAYKGLWGAPEFLPFFGGSGPRGPRYQGIKWSNPFRWVMRHCIADDVPYWLEMFASWEPVTEPVANASAPAPEPALAAEPEVR